MLAKIILLASLGSLAAGSHYFEEKHSAPQPYRFGYEVKDKESTQYRHEEGDGHGSVKGSYGYTDDKGIYREVHYVADKQGFRAKINTNEPGTSNQDSAGVEIQSNAKHEEHHIPIRHVHHDHHIPVYHKEQVVPVYQKVEVVPIRPLKHFQNYKSLNFDNFSPIHGFSYKPLSILSYRPSSSFNSGFRNNVKSHLGNFNIRNSFGYSGLGNHFGNLDIENFSGLDNFDNIKEFDTQNFDNLGDFSSLGNYNKFGRYSNIGGLGSTYGFDNINKDEIQKLIEEAKSQNQHTYSRNHGNFNNNNDFHFKEFRNIGNHKYSRSSYSDFDN